MIEGFKKNTLYYSKKQCLPIYIIMILISGILVSCGDPTGSDSPETEPIESTVILKDHIVFSSNRSGANQIYVMNADGSEQVQVTTNSSSDISPIISPDGSKIVFLSVSGENTDMYIINADGNELHLLAECLGRYNKPTFSPDGNTIVFKGFTPSGECKIFSININGSELAPLTDGICPFGGVNPVFSPDGSKIAFAAHDGNSIDIYTMNSDGSELIKLTDDSDDNSHPTYSPDGSKIAYLVLPENFRFEPQQIYVMNSDGSEQTNLTDNSIFKEGAPFFSPDGSKIVYVRNDNIIVMNADGSEQTTLTEEGTNFGPVFSPDGSKIAFSRRYGNDRLPDIYKLNTDGSGSIINLTDDASTEDGYPYWGPKE